VCSWATASDFTTVQKTGPFAHDDASNMALSKIVDLQFLINYSMFPEEVQAKDGLAFVYVFV
jgi:hypothetical protein